MSVLFWDIRKEQGKDFMCGFAKGLSGIRNGTKVRIPVKKTLNGKEGSSERYNKYDPYDHTGSREEQDERFWKHMEAFGELCDYSSVYDEAGELYLLKNDEICFERERETDALFCEMLLKKSYPGRIAVQIGIAHNYRLGEYYDHALWELEPGDVLLITCGESCVDAYRMREDGNPERYFTRERVPFEQEEDIFPLPEDTRKLYVECICGETGFAGTVIIEGERKQAADEEELRRIKDKRIKWLCDVCTIDCYPVDDKFAPEYTFDEKSLEKNLDLEGIELKADYGAAWHREGMLDREPLFCLRGRCKEGEKQASCKQNSLMLFGAGCRGGKIASNFTWYKWPDFYEITEALVGNVKECPEMELYIHIFNFPPRQEYYTEEMFRKSVAGILVQGRRIEYIFDRKRMHELFLEYNEAYPYEKKPEEETFKEGIVCIDFGEGGKGIMDECFDFTSEPPKEIKWSAGTGI